MIRQRGNAAGGFTLLETLVALAITALVLAALYGAVTRAAAARARATRSAERIAASRAVLLRIAQEIEAALAPTQAGGADRFVAVPAPDDGPPWSALRLATFAPAPGRADEGRAVAYDVEPLPGQPGKGALVRREGTRFAPPGTPEPLGTPLLEGIETFRVRCFDGSTWSVAWTMPALPRAVEIAIGVDDGAGGTDELATAVALPPGSSS